MKILVKDPAFSGVANGQRATAQLPTGWTYHEIFLVARKSGGTLMTAAEIAAGIGQIFVKRDGVAFIEGVPASVLRDIYAYYFDANQVGSTYSIALSGNSETVTGSTTPVSINQAGIIPIPLSMPKYLTPFERDAFSLGTADISSLSIEAQITSAVPVTLEIISRKEAVSRPFGAHIAICPYTDFFAGTGIFETAKMPKDTLGAAYRASFINSAYVTEATVFRNNERIFEEVPDALNKLVQLQSGRVPNANYYVIDYGLDNVPSDVLRLPVSDLRHRLNFSSAPNSFTVYNTFIEGLSVQ